MSIPRCHMASISNGLTLYRVNIRSKREGELLHGTAKTYVPLGDKWVIFSSAFYSIGQGILLWMTDRLHSRQRISTSEFVSLRWIMKLIRPFTNSLKWRIQ